MGAITDFVRRTARGAVNGSSAIGMSFDRFARELVVKTSAGRTAYAEGNLDGATAKPIRTLSFATAVIPSTAPGNASPQANLAPFSGGFFYWKNDTATHTSITIDIYAMTDIGDIVLIDTLATVAPLVETAIPWVGYRNVYIVVTAVVGGGPGDIDLYFSGN